MTAESTLRERIIDEAYLAARPGQYDRLMQIAADVEQEVAAARAEGRREAAGAIDFDTTCLNCAKTIERAYGEWVEGHKAGRRDVVAAVEALADDIERQAAVCNVGNTATIAQRLRNALEAATGGEAAGNAPSEPSTGARSAGRASEVVPEGREAAGGTGAHRGVCGRRHPGPCAMVRGTCLQPETP